MAEVLQLGQTVGILGGGQLGRMLSVAASRLGLRSHIFTPESGPIAGQVANEVTTAEYSDEEALRRFAESVDVITYEFENILASALDVLEEQRDVYPNRKVLEDSQDRWVEKNLLQGLGLGTAPCANIESDRDLAEAMRKIGVPSILKTRRFGYDGKGQVVLREVEQAAAAWDGLKRSPCVLEGFVDFDFEVSVIGARSIDGQVVCFDPGENVHRGGILRTTTVPSRLSAERQASAIGIATAILEALDYVGVLGVELFVTPDSLLVNEIAPRVHNSGHWTQNGCAIDQFEQHIRAVAGWPLGDGRRHSNVVMKNLIGDEILDYLKLASDPVDSLHFYGKGEARPGRKVGHINRVTGPAGG